MKKFITIWAGEMISSIGSGMTSFALLIYMYQITSSATWVSILSLLAFLPTILLNPLGGVLADRYDRRLMMICGDLLSAIGLLYVYVSIQAGQGGIAQICIGVTISSAFLSLLEPAYKATVSDLLTEDEYAKASGMVQIAANSKYLISPFLAGLLLTVVDIRTILLIDISTFFITTGTILLVKKKIGSRKPKAEPFHIVAELREGVRCIVRDNGVRSLVVLMGFMCFFIAFIQTLMMPMILSFANSNTLGTMESISAVGMVIGSGAIGILKIHKNYANILMFSLMAAGGFMALTGSTTNIVLLVGYCTAFFIALPFINTSAEVLIRIRIPNEKQGRAWGVISVLTQMGFVIAYAICGPLADHVFEPMLQSDGALAQSVGAVIGTGSGRGIGFMLILAGVVMAAFAVLYGLRKSIRGIEQENRYVLDHHTK